MTATSTSAPPLTAEELRRLDAWWRAANYLSVGQIYLLDNPLLDERKTRALLTASTPSSGLSA
jgi:xylulose-5-phosphate/fructose-6-phosphate phosphoketolase